MNKFEGGEVQSNCAGADLRDVLNVFHGFEV